MTATEICSKIDPELRQFIHTVVVLIKIAVPLILIILGMIDFGKGVLASKEDEIKKGQQVFIKRLVAGVLVFFTFSIVQFAFNLLPIEGEFFNCANQILNGETSETSVHDNSNGDNNSNDTNNNQNVNNNSNSNNNNQTTSN